MDQPSSQPLAVALPPSLTARLEGDVAFLRLARPAKRNALDDETILGIEAFFEACPSR